MIPRILIDVKDRASDALKANVAAMEPRKVAAVSGPRLREKVRDHIKRLPRNKKGWPSTGFWEDAARGTTWDANNGSVSIKIKKLGFRQRYHGGVIRAVEAKALTIPISPQAYGKTAADFPGSFLLKTKKGAYLVRYAGGNTPKGKFKKQNSTLEFLFQLKVSVRQPEMPWIIPDATTLNAVAFAALEEYFRQVKAKTGGGK